MTTQEEIYINPSLGWSTGQTLSMNPEKERSGAFGRFNVFNTDANRLMPHV